MPERDASADRAHALPVDAHQRRYGAPGRVHAQPCDLPLEVCFVKFLWAVSAFLLVRLSGCF